MALLGGSTTQVINVEEIYMGGAAGASSPALMVVGRDSTVGATPTALSSPNSSGALHPSTAALAAVPIGHIAAATPPQRSNSVTIAKLTLPFNAFGGIVRWNASNTDIKFILLGNAASLGELSLSAFTGGTPGLMGSHMLFEPL
jgi:hypothetical protein